MRVVSQMKDSELDNAIDRALESYTAGEPDPQFAERIVTAATASRRARMRRRSRLWMNSGARPWALAATATLACLAMAALWMHSERLEVAIVHTNTLRPGETIGPAQAAPNVAVPAEAKVRDTPQTKTVRPRDPAQEAADIAAHRKAGGHAVGTAAGDEQLAAEGVEPILFKPIAMAPIRLGVSGQESQ